MAQIPPRRIAALRRFRRRCWAAVALCLTLQVGTAAAQSWADLHRPASVAFYLEPLS